METVKFKDVAHLYFNSEVPVILPDGRETYMHVLSRLSMSDGSRTGNFPRQGDFIWHRLEEVKPILRPLSSITAEEAIHLVKLNEWKQRGDHPHTRVYGTYVNAWDQVVVTWGDSVIEKNVPATKEAFYPNEFQYLCSIRIDLFGLIESGQAIDATTNNQS